MQGPANVRQLRLSLSFSHRANIAEKKEDYKMENTDRNVCKKERL